MLAHKACVRCLFLDCEGAKDATKCTRKLNCFECQGLHNYRLHEGSGKQRDVNVGADEKVDNKLNEESSDLLDKNINKEGKEEVKLKEGSGDRPDNLGEQNEVQTLKMEEASGDLPDDTKEGSGGYDELNRANEQSDIIEESGVERDLSDEGRGKQPDSNANVDENVDDQLNEGSSDMLGKNTDK